MIRTDPTTRPDVKEVLASAKASLAHIEAAHAAEKQQRKSASRASGRHEVYKSGSSSRGDGDEMSGEGDCALVMEAVLDKLKLLQYEGRLLRPRGLKPLPRGYFVIADTWPREAQVCDPDPDPEPNPELSP